MPYLTLRDNTRLFYKDWGNPAGEPVFFSHGWPLNSDNFEAQMAFLAADQARGNPSPYRVIAHDRRGHGRSDQPWHGNDIDTWADDIAQLFEHLELEGATLVGHSTGGGDLTRFAATSKRNGTAYGGGGEKEKKKTNPTSWVKKLVLISAITPSLVQTAWNPAGVPLATLNQQRAALVDNRAQFFLDVPSGPFFGFNRPNATDSQGLVQSWFNAGMQASFKAAFDTIASWETDFRADLESLHVPVLVLHGDDDQIVPFGVGNQTVKYLKNGSLKVYKGGPHALPNIRAEEVNRDISAFLKEGEE